MAVRGEEVAGSIDAHVREAIERMVGEIRSSIEDVRDVVDSQLKAALQSVQADVNSISFLPHIQKSIGALEESITASVPAPAAPAPAAGDGPSRVKRALQHIEKGKSQVDVLNALLEQCVEFGSRAALLILRGETFSGWKGVGFSKHGGNDEMVKRFNAAPGLIPELDEVLRDERVVTWNGENLSTRLGVGASQSAILVPMVIKDKVAAAIYVDAVGDDTANLDSSSVEILVFATGLLIDTLAIRKKIPSPSLNDGTIAPTAATAAFPAVSAPAAPRPAAPPPAAPPPAPPKAAVPPPAPRPTPPPVAPPPPPAEPAEASATVAFSASQMRDMIQSARPSFNMPTADDFGGGTSPGGPGRPAPEPPKAAPPAPPAPASAPSEDRPSTQYIPPAGIRNAAAGGGAANEDSKKHDEARRFARLLVSEIKLYNESKVEQGRKNNDLYERLKEDIDRSRQMYDERIGEDVRKTSNYFYDELVRILADGQAATLGL
jgi:hypothetical protein